MKGKQVCIFGGSGFVGQSIASQLVSSGYHVKILTRHKESCQALSVLPNTQIIETDVYDQHKIDKTLSGADVVINLVGILNEKQHNGDGFRKAHVELTRKILNACHHNKVPRLLQMSALNANAAQGASHYLRTKGEAENAIHAFAGDTKVTSFKPSIIFGEDDSFFNRFAGLIQLFPGIFPLACANARFAPIHVEEVASKFVNSIDDKSTYDKRIEMCGPEIYTLKELIQFTCKQVNRRRIIIALPDTLAQLQAIVFEYLPGKLFSIDNYDSLQADSVCSGEDVYTGQHSIKTIVPKYLGEKTKHKQDDEYRKASRR